MKKSDSARKKENNRKGRRKQNKQNRTRISAKDKQRKNRGVESNNYEGSRRRGGWAGGRAGGAGARAAGDKRFGEVFTDEVLKEAR